MVPFAHISYSCSMNNMRSHTHTDVGWEFPVNLMGIESCKSEILLAQISVCLRVLAGVHVFEAAEIQIRQQILDPCLLLASGLRDYEIKLDRRISAARESLQLFLFGN
jgi:hypothetical protein